MKPSHQSEPAPPAHILHLTGCCALLCIAFLVPLQFFPGYASIPEHAKVSTLLVLLGMATAGLWASGTPILSAIPRSILLLIVIWLLLLSVSTITSLSPVRSLFGIHYRYNGLLLHVSYGWLFVLTAACVQQSPRLLSCWFGAISVSLFLLCGIGLLQYAGIHPLNPNETGIRIRPTSTLSFVNLFSGYLTVAGLVIAARLPFQHRWWAIGFLLLMVFVCGYLIRTGSSRGCWLVSGCGLGVLAMCALATPGFRQHTGKILRLHLTLIAFCMGVALFPAEEKAPGAFGWMLDTPVSADLNTFLRMDTAQRLQSSLQSEDLTRSTRFEFWQSAFRTWTASPLLGTGPDTFAYTYQQHRSPENVQAYGPDAVAHDAHNLVLHNLATWGMLPTLAWGVLLLAIIGCGLRAIHSLGYPECTWLVALVVAFVAGHALQLLVVASISTNTMLWMMGGFIIGTATRMSSVSPAALSTSRWRCFLVAAGLTPAIPVALLPVATEAVFVQANHHLEEGQVQVGIRQMEWLSRTAFFREEYLERQAALLLARGALQQEAQSLQQAHDRLQRGLTRFPLNSRLHALLGRLNSLQADRTGDEAYVRMAIKHFREASRLHPVHAQYAGWRGEMAERLGFLKEAQDAYRQAIELGTPGQSAFYRERLDTLTDRQSVEPGQ